MGNPAARTPTPPNAIVTGAQRHAAGFADVYPLRDLAPDPVRSMDRAAELLAAVSEQLGRMLAA